MKVLVTGGAGFIGSHTVDLLVKQGFKTIVIDTNKHDFQNPIAIYYQGSITDKELLEKIFAEHAPDAVIHLAAQVCVQTSMSDPVFDVNTNVLGTILLLEQCRIYQSKIIFASSAAVYGIPIHLPIFETHPTNPISIYGMSKLTSEKYIQLYHQQFGIEYCILRYSNVFGPRQGYNGEGGVISIFVDRFTNGKNPIIFGNGEQSRDFIYVEDVARANIAALKRGKNQVFNVSTNTETTINHIVEMLQSKIDSRLYSIHQPAKNGDIPTSRLNSGAIHSLLSWAPVTTIETGLTRMIDDSMQKTVPLILT